MAGNKHIRPAEVESIVAVIRGWSSPRFTWAEVCDASAPILGYKPTRQGLFGHDAIASAFDVRKRKKRIAPDTTAPKPSSLAVAAKRLETIKSENEELKLQNDRFRDLFQVWQYNAYKRGMTEAQLNEPLPKIDREVNEQDDK